MDGRMPGVDARDTGLTWCCKGEPAPTRVCVLCTGQSPSPVPATRSSHSQPDKGHPGQGERQEQNVGEERGTGR